MAKQRVPGVTDRILECAKEEFARRGFQDASIRDIAAKAETSPRAIYTRFSNKEALFDAIVNPVMNGLVGIYTDYAGDYWDTAAEMGANSADAEASTDDPSMVYTQMTDYIYDHADEVRLALTTLDGAHAKKTIELLTSMNCMFLSSFLNMADAELPKATVRVLHLLTHSFYAGLFEPLLHGMSREEARFYVQRLCTFFKCGIRGIEL